MQKLAIFDIDFTITRRETLIQFYIFMLKKNIKLISHLPRSIFGFLLYTIKHYDEKNVKEVFLKFIDGIDEREMERNAKVFYRDRLSKILYKDALDMIQKMKSEGYKIYLISASPEFYLKEFYSIKEVDKVIGTRIKMEEGRYLSKLDGKNNKGEEKVARLKEVLKEGKIQVDFENSYMFSDSLSDLPLFDLVGNPYLINYKKNHDKIKKLNWR